MDDLCDGHGNRNRDLGLLFALNSRFFRVIWFIAFFLWAFAVSSAWSQTYYANRCSSGGSVRVDPPVVATCHDSGTSTVLGPSCVYTGHSTTWNRYYACFQGETWADFDTDQDGILNGVDSDPYNAAIVDSDNDGVADGSDVCNGVDDNAQADPAVWSGINSADEDNDGTPNCNDFCNNTGGCAALCTSLHTQQGGASSQLVDVICVASSSLQCGAHSAGPVLSTTNPEYPYDRVYNFTGFTCDPLTEFNPLNPNDSDGDGVEDVDDPCPTDATDSCDAGDPDGDGLPNSTDPCPDDGLNVCDAGDLDGDGVNNGQDPCPEDATDSCDAGDSDGDGVTNGQDICPNSATDQCAANDPDGDGQYGDDDPCPNQADNACTTTDSDGDGLMDSVDSCPNDPTNLCNIDTSNAENVNVINVPSVRVINTVDAQVEGMEDLVTATEDVAVSIEILAASLDGECISYVDENGDPVDWTDPDCLTDDDNDGVADWEDACPGDPVQACITDSDGDGQMDDVDPCPNDATDSCGTTGGNDDGYTTPTLDSGVPEFGAAISAFGDRIEAAPLISGFGGMALPSGTGLGCPVYAFSLPIGPDPVEFVIDAHCVLAEQVRAMLYAVMMGIWILVGVRNVMEA